jgi:hypothetical protein
MTALAVQNFVSAAVGMAIAVALVRGLVRRRSNTIGNFWVDLTRSVTRILLPISIIGALVLVSQGVIQNLNGFTVANTLEGAVQLIPGGPAASQEIIKELSTRGRTTHRHPSIYCPSFVHGSDRRRRLACSAHDRPAPPGAGGIGRMRSGRSRRNRNRLAIAAPEGHRLAR